MRGSWGATSLVAQTVKHLPAVQETRVRSLGWKVPLEKGTATHSSILAWRIPCTEKPGGLQPVGSQRVGHDRVTNMGTVPWWWGSVWPHGDMLSQQWAAGSPSPQPEQP